MNRQAPMRVCRATERASRRCRPVWEFLCLAGLACGMLVSTTPESGAPAPARDMVWDDDEVAARAEADSVVAVPEARADAAAVAENARQLAEIRARIQTHRERAAALTNRERDAADLLADIDTEARLVKSLLGKLDRRERLLQARSDSLRAALAEHQKYQSERQARVARRLRALYSQGSRSDLEFVLTADSFTSLVARLRYATEMARLDRRLLQRMQSDGDLVREQERELQEALAGIWEAREEARRERVNLEVTQAQRRRELTGVRREREQVEARLVELEANARRLTELLADLEHERLTGTPRPPEPGGPFASLAGRLDWPAAGEIVRPFGRSVHPEFKTVTLHNGITLAAPRGAPVYAVAGGSVEFVDSLPGYGVCVILDHGDGYYSLYAHTQRVLVARGARVAAGQILAEVGVAEGEGRPMLYFEIRHGKTPQDPLRWLRPRR